MIPIKLGVVINGSYTLKNLWEIFDPDDLNNFGVLPNDDARMAKAIQLKMFPTEVKVSSEVYCRNSDRTADYELENIQLINAKAKPELTWSYLKKEYAKNLLDYLGFKYNFKQTIDGSTVIVPEDAPIVMVQYWDFNGTRTIRAYLGQSIDGTLVSYQEGNVFVEYWENFRIAFPER